MEWVLSLGRCDALGQLGSPLPTLLMIGVKTLRTRKCRHPVDNVPRKSPQRKQSSAAWKARVALEALKGLKTVNELARTYGVHPTQIAHGKHRVHKERPDIVSARRVTRAHDQEAFQAQ